MIERKEQSRSFALDRQQSMYEKTIEAEAKGADIMRKTGTGALATLSGAMLLAACGGAPEEKTYEVDATDESGGELIVSDVDPETVPVDTPDTEMVNVPAEEGAEGEAAE